jgi:hypothetical protein
MINSAVNKCFGCGRVNPVGLRLKFAIETSASGGVTATAPVHCLHFPCLNRGVHSILEF